MAPKRSNEDLNKLLHEKVMQECWHDFGMDAIPGTRCSKCGRAAPFFNPDYLYDPAAYWRLLQKVKEHKDWYKFITVTFSRGLGQEEWELFTYKNVANSIHHFILDQRRGCEAIAEFFCREGK